MKNSNRVEVRTSQFEFSHGKKPSGRGTWAFEIGGEVVFFWGKETFGEAKKAAREEAVKRGVGSVTVCS